MPKPLTVAVRLGSKVSRSSIDIQFDELTALLDRWRKDTVEVASLGVPPHITLLYPWRNAPLKNSDLQQLEEILVAFEPFDLCFDRVGTFEGGVVYLALKDERAPREMMKAIFAAFPNTPPYSGTLTDPSPHLTVAKCSPESLSNLSDEIAEALSLPMTFHVSEIVIMEEREDGRWFNRHVAGLHPN